MTSTTEPNLLTGADDALRDALAEADVPPLMATVAYLTGDLSLLRPELRPDPMRMLEPTAGIEPEQQAEARELAFEALRRWRDAGRPAPAVPSAEALTEMLEFVVGGVPMADYRELFLEELGLDGADLRAPTWHKDDVARGVDFRVLVIGAGMSGLLAAHRLKQAGLDVIVVEKDRDVGGTWLENSYPGCRVDVGNLFYSYSFAQSAEWPQHYSQQATLLDYFRRCADELGIRPLIRFSTDVVSLTFDETNARWRAELRTADGTTDTIEVHAVVSGVGQLNRPNMPDIKGMDTFAGPAFHSARWRHDVDLTGKRVAVIGTGASSSQLIPVIAEQVDALTIFQRTPNWLAPTPDYHDAVSPRQRDLFRDLPSYAQWSRFWLFWRNAEGMLPLVGVDPDWEPKDRSVSAMNDLLRQLFTGYLEMEFADRPDLLAKVVPQYPPSAKRVLRDNGIWARTLKRDNVELVTEPIAEITPTGVRTSDGAEHEVDVIVYGTGFEASRFLMPMRVTGRGGVDLHEQWHGDARAYLGVTIPGFPNLFCMYGPNTNIVINGSIIFFSECEVVYILESLHWMLKSGARAIDCRRDVHDEYNVRIDAGNRLRAWGASDVNSWYKNAKGHVTQNWPFSLLEYWQQTRTFNPSDYEAL
ncbi:MAG TPA: NAD(P)/FAD-dependent oxidoreductase [Acidimicrobiia bacterium]